ncbi:unnamed protein product [Lactuca saligna]|uniref:Uncharacterized protein n=1 Tax=Lactuca saligna TaxID=75948 RepID=A0AA36E3K5_LACSI|nr:unnamed protein product [Lactuca saligna]
MMLPEYLMQKPTVDEAIDTLKKFGVPEDEMAALDRQLAPAAPKTTTTTMDSNNRKLGFVSGGVQLLETASRIQNQEEIELPESDDEEDDDGKVEISQKDVLEVVFGGLVRKRDGEEEEEQVKKDNANGDAGSQQWRYEREEAEVFLVLASIN